jgi:nicotinate-nucleotide pyrophosphorylase (carboxylating)
MCVADAFTKRRTGAGPMKPDYDPIDAALKEDIGEGDITTDLLVPETLRSIGRISAREKAIIAGGETAAEVFRRVDPSIHIEVIRQDGAQVEGGETIIEVRGLARSILKTERVALNFLQRLCGIATLTRQFVDAARNGHVKILDTRKTTPGLRQLEKAAVVAGGGANHRFGLYDMVLVKDNHLTASSGFSGFANRIQQFRKERPNVRIEVEASQLEQVRAFVEIEGIDVILLDNMSPAQLREAVALRKHQVKFEASGGINLKNIHRFAATGVDYISVGALTHSPRAIDLSLDIINVGG